MSVTFVRRSIRRFRWHHFRTRSSASRSTTFTCPRPRPAHRSWLTQRCSWPRTRNTCGPPSNKTSKSSWPARCKGETTTWAPAACGWTLPPAPYRNCTVISPYTNNIIPNTILFRIHAVTYTLLPLAVTEQTKGSIRRRHAVVCRISAESIVSLVTNHLVGHKTMMFARLLTSISINWSETILVTQ